MATLKSYIEHLRTFAEELAATQARRALSVSLDGKALVQLRIQSSGQNAQGNLFSSYNPIYAQERQAAGYQTAFKDFTRTGRLFASLTPRIAAQSFGVVEVVIKPNNRQDQDKLNGQVRKDGNLLLLSTAEVQTLNQNYRGKVTALPSFQNIQ